MASMLNCVALLDLQVQDKESGTAYVEIVSCVLHRPWRTAALGLRNKPIQSAEVFQKLNTTWRKDMVRRMISKHLNKGPKGALAAHIRADVTHEKGMSRKKEGECFFLSDDDDEAVLNLPFTTISFIYIPHTPTKFRAQYTKYPNILPGSPQV